MVGDGATTGNSSGGITMIFDNNDLLAVFRRQRQAARLRPAQAADIHLRPERAGSQRGTEGTANQIYDAWDGRPVRLYKNKNYDIEYYGLMIWDKLGWYAKRRRDGRLHKQEKTNGCIFIVDPDTPPLSNPAQLNLFEPQLIKDIQTMSAPGPSPTSAP